MSVDLVPDCAREWEQKHNEMLSIHDYSAVPDGLSLNSTTMALA